MWILLLLTTKTPPDLLLTFVLCSVLERAEISSMSSQIWGLSSLLYSGYASSFPVGKAVVRA
jgi:hypothetical protein